MTRIGVTQRVAVVGDYGERRDCLDQAWTALFESFGHTLVPLPNTVSNVAEYLTDLDVEGLVLTGGNDLGVVDDPAEPAPERDHFEGAALDVAMERGWPILGVCRGLQLVNVHFGGAISTVEGHVASPHRVSFEVVDDLAIALPDEMTVNSYHGYGIHERELAGPLRAISMAPDGTIEAVTHTEFDLVAVMWHPERDEQTEVDERLVEHLFGRAADRGGGGEA